MHKLKSALLAHLAIGLVVISVAALVGFHKGRPASRLDRIQTDVTNKIDRLGNVTDQSGEVANRVASKDGVLSFSPKAPRDSTAALSTWELTIEEHWTPSRCEGRNPFYTFHITLNEHGSHHVSFLRSRFDDLFDYGWLGTSTGDQEMTIMINECDKQDSKLDEDTIARWRWLIYMKMSEYIQHQYTFASWGYF